MKNIKSGADITLSNISNRDILGLLGVKNSASGFYYKGFKYGIFMAKDGNLLINSFKEKKTVKLSNFLIENGVAKDPKELEKIITNGDFETIDIENIKSDNSNNEKTFKRFTLSIIDNYSNEFIEHKLIQKLQLGKHLLEGYKTLLNERIYLINTITATRVLKLVKGKFKVAKYRKILPNPIEILQGKNLEIAISNHQEHREFNIRFKPNGQKWRTLSGGKNAGFYFEQKEFKKSILYLCEGGKDGLNTFLAQGQDVYAYDSKNALDSKLKELIESGKYSNYYFLNDRDDLAIYENISKKIDTKNRKLHFLNWSKIDKELPQLKDKPKADISDILEQLLTSGENIRTLKRGAFNKLIKKSSTNFDTISKNDEAKKYQEWIEYHKSNNNIERIKSLYLHISKEFFKDKKHQIYKELYRDTTKYLLEHRTTFAKSSTLIINRYLTEQLESLVASIENNRGLTANLINSPTGSGKSTAIREIAESRKCLIITPVKNLTYEFESGNIGLLERAKNRDELIADIQGFKAKGKSIVLTTDRLVINYDLILELIKDGYFEHIMFDEQHLIPQAFDFRYTVVKTHKLIREMVKKFDICISYWSGTALNFDDTEYNHIEVKSKASMNIKYSIQNDSLNKILNSQLAKIDIDDSILLYCSTKEAVKELSEYILAEELNQTINDVKLQEPNLLIVNITSKKSFFYSNGEKITLENNLSNLPKGKKVFYVVTSKVTTGVNLKNLKSIIQYGTVYNPENVMQLYARLREDGEVIVIPIANSTNFTMHKSNIVGLFTAIYELSQEFKKSSIKDLIDKNPRVRQIIKQKSDLEEVNFKNFASKFRNELQTLQFYKLINIKTLMIDGNYAVDDIELINDDISELRATFEQIQLNKEVDLYLSLYANEDIENFRSFYNSTQRFQIGQISINKVKKFKTLEQIEFKKDKKDEAKNRKLLEINRYFEHFTEYSKLEKERIIKLFGKVNVANIAKFIDKAIELNQDYLNKDLNYGFRAVRRQEDMRKFIAFKLEMHKELLNMLQNLENQFIEHITVSELIDLYAEAGYKITNGNANCFKEPIQHIAENIDKFSRKWKFVANSYINSKKIRNSLKRVYSRDEKELIKYLNKNSVKDLKNFINHTSNTIEQLQNTFSGKNGQILLNRIIDDYLDQFET